MLLSEKDSKLKIPLRRSVLEFEEAQELGERQEFKEIKEAEKRELLVSNLKIKVPISEELKTNQEQEQDEDEHVEVGSKTPTSLEKRIPLFFQCPNAPRKPKSEPCTKRKLMPVGRRVILDLSNEIDSLFSPSIVGAKMKKFRHENQI